MRNVLCQFITICILAGILSAAACMAAETVWDADLGWIDLSKTPAETLAAQYRHATGLFVSGQYAAALDMFERVRKNYPNTSEANCAAFRVAECQMQLNHPRRALRTTMDLLAALPDDIPKERVIALQLDLAKVISEGSASLGMQTFSDIAESAETPEHKFAARMGQGEALFRRNEFGLAADAYKAALSAWPEAPDANEALYHAAICDLRECRDRKGDDKRLQDCYDNFFIFSRRVADDPRIETAIAMANAVSGAIDEEDLGRRRVYYGITYFHDGNYKKAGSIFRKGAKRYVDTEVGGIAQYYRGETFFARGKHRAAFDIFSSFLKNHPDSLNSRKALNRMMEIAETAMNAKERSFLRRILPPFRKNNRTFAIDVLETITDRDPTGPLADDAFMYIGQCQLEREKYGEASAAFRAIIDEYPRSEWMYAALYNAGLSELRGSEYSEDNEYLLEGAARAFELYLDGQPNGAFASSVRELLGECRERQATDLLDIAEFYRRQKKYESVALYCRIILDEHPESNAAGTAQKLLNVYGEEEKTQP